MEDLKIEISLSEHPGSDAWVTVFSSPKASLESGKERLIVWQGEGVNTNLLWLQEAHRLIELAIKQSLE